MNYNNESSSYIKTLSKIIKCKPDIDAPKFLSNFSFALTSFPFVEWDYWLKQYLKIVKIMPDENIISILAKGQILGKQWIYEEMKRIGVDYGIIFILCGWSGFIARMILDSGLIQCEKIRSFDINEKCTEMSTILNWDWRIKGRWFKSSTQDITNMNYTLCEFDYIKRDGITKEKLIESPRTIINTSCEHIKDFDSWWNKLPKGLIAIIQSTDHEDLDEHINSVKNIEEFKKQAPMTKLLYAGERQFFYYKRFMLIGIT